MMMRRNSSTTPAEQGSLSPNDDEHASRSKRAWQRRVKRRTRQRIHVVLFIGGVLLVFMWIMYVLVSWLFLPIFESGLRAAHGNTTEPTTDVIADRTHRDFRPPKFQRFTENAPECLPIQAEDVSFTLVMQMSSDRLWMMEHHCDRWKNISPISIAILTNRTQADILGELHQLGCDTTQITVQVVRSDLYPQEDYPVNVLRNLALSVVTTSHVMYADIDFWESEDLRDLLNLLSVRKHLAEDYKRAIVVPAFQLNRQCHEWRECPENNVPAMPRNRHDLKLVIKNKHGYPFDPTNRAGHGSTLYVPWLTTQTEPGSLVDIPCVYSNRYEPYLAFRYCRDLPPFQEEFSGYGKNKMTMVMHMIRSGYQFAQLGGGFLVHYPHLDSKSRQEWNEMPKAVQPHKVKGKWKQAKPKAVEGIAWNQYKRGRVDATFVEFRTWLKEQVPDEPVILKCNDAEDDDWRLWYDRTEQ